MNISGMNISTLRSQHYEGEGSLLNFPSGALSHFPTPFEASWTSPPGFAIVLKAGVALGMCLSLWVPFSLNFDLIILLSCQFFDALKKRAFKHFVAF